MSNSDYEELVLELFDNNPTRSMITSIAKMYGASYESIIEILQKHGREITFKRGRKPKPKHEEVTEEVKEDSSEELSEAAEQQLPIQQLPIPEYVKELVMKEMDSLEEQLKALEQETLEKQQKYTVLANFLKN